MSQAAHRPSQLLPASSTDKRAILVFLLGLLALLSFGVLTLPSDLLLLSATGLLGSISQPLAPLTNGPEVLFSPLGVIAATSAIRLGRGSVRQSKGISTIGLAFGWVALGFYIISVNFCAFSIGW